MTQEFNVTNGSVIVESGAGGTDTILISTPAVDMAVAILEDELPWLIETLTGIRRDLLADAAAAQDMARLAKWNAQRNEVNHD